MEGRIITEKIIEKFKASFLIEEKSKVTVEKYLRDVRAFAEYVQVQISQKEW